MSLPYQHFKKEFCVTLSTQIFTDEERSTSNVSGRNKTKLDPTRIAYVKQTTFEMWPLKQGEDMKRAWADCVVSIDEANRRLNRKNKV